MQRRLSKGEIQNKKFSIRTTRHNTFCPFLHQVRHSKMLLTLFTTASSRFSIVLKVFSEYLPVSVLLSCCKRNTLALSAFFFALGSLQGCTYVHTHQWLIKHTHIRTYIHTYIHTHIHQHTHTYTHIQSSLQLIAHLSSLLPPPLKKLSDLGSSCENVSRNI